MAGTPWTAPETMALSTLGPAQYADYADQQGWPGRTPDAIRLKYADMTASKGEVRIAKKVPAFDYDRTVAWLEEGQAIRQARSGNQHETTITIPSDRPIGLIGIGDLHMGAWSTDYGLLQQLTQEILNTPDLYVALLGDLAHLAVKLRGVDEVMDNALSPDMQIDMVLAWIETIRDRVLFATYGNHEDRLQRQSGSNRLYEALKGKLVFADGIAHVDFCVGSAVYRGAFAHRYRWRSEHRATWGPYKYLLREGHGNDLDFAFAADSHVPGIDKSPIGGKVYTMVNCGSIQTMSGYAKKFFSLLTHDAYPLIELDHEVKRVTPFYAISEWSRCRQFGVVH